MCYDKLQKRQIDVAATVKGFRERRTIAANIEMLVRPALLISTKISHTTDQVY